MRKTLFAILMVGGLIAAPAADAHYVTGGTATCTEATAAYVEFNDNEKPISWQVNVDSVPLTSGTRTFAGSSTTIVAPYPAALPAGDHIVRWTSSWPGQGGMNGSFEQVVQGCPGPPAPAAAPPAASPPAASAPSPAIQVRPARQTATNRSRRFGTPGKQTKPCRYGRRTLRDSQGRRFTVCKSKPKPVVVRVPKFTG
jgi:hypothetical protein